MPNATLGRGLGGGGIVNAMIYVRGIKEDFQNWNVPGWSWQDVLNWYKKSENNTGMATQNDHLYHGNSGPMQVSGMKGVTLK